MTMAVKLTLILRLRHLVQAMIARPCLRSGATEASVEPKGVADRCVSLDIAVGWKRMGEARSVYKATDFDRELLIHK